MNLILHPIAFSGEQLTLTNQRALYWPKESALLLSDLHLGKAAHFRKNGIPMPQQIVLQDLMRLEQLILHFGPAKVMVTGDLVHAGHNREVGLFGALTQRHPGVRFILVRGNHDRITEKNLALLGIHEVHTELQLGQILLTHELRPPGAAGNISGHVHPGIALKLTSGQVMKFPCFAVSGHRLILPAFSLFTGLDTLSLPPDAVCYGFHEEGFFVAR